MSNNLIDRRHSLKITEQNIKKTVELLTNDEVFINYCKELNIDKNEYDLFVRECIDKCFSVLNRLIKQGVYSVRICNFGTYAVRETAIITHFKRLIGAINKQASNTTKYKLCVDVFYNQFKLIEYYKELRKKNSTHETNYLWNYIKDLIDTISFDYKSGKELLEESNIKGE